MSYLDQSLKLNEIPGDWGHRIYGSTILECHKQIAIRHDNKLTVLNLDGQITQQLTTPEGIRYFGDCLYDPNSNQVWLSLSHSDDEFELQVVNCDNWNVIDRNLLNDPFHGSDQTFVPTYRKGFVGMYLTTGGCGEEFYILSIDDNKITVENSEIGDSRYAQFSPYENEFLVNEGHTAILRYGYPNVGCYNCTKHLYDQLQAMSGGNEDANIGSSIAYLDQHHALICDDADIVVVLDLRTMELGRQVTVEFKTDTPLDHPSHTDWSYFYRIHDQIVFQKMVGSFNNWSTALYLVPVEQFLSDLC